MDTIQIDTLGNMIYLPMALLDDQGNVDERFLEDLWSGLPKPGSKIRTLIKEITSKSIKPTESAIHALANLIKNPVYLKKWVLSSGSRITSPVWLIRTQVVLTNKALSFSSLEKEGFFVNTEKDEKAYFFCFDKMDVFIEALVKSPSDSRELALFVWAMNIETITARIKFPNEPSLSQFGLKMSAALEEAGLNGILDGLRPAPCVLPEVEVTEIIPFSDKITPAFPSKLAVKQEVKSNFFVESEKRLKKFDEKITKYKHLIQQISIKANGLSQDDTHFVALQNLVDLASQAKEERRILIEECRSEEFNINSAFNAALMKVGLSFSDSVVAVNLMKPSVWLEAIEKRLTTLELVEKEIRAFDDVTVLSLLNKDRVASVGASQSLSSAVDGVKDLYKQYEMLHSGFYAEEKFRELVSKNHNDLDWNIYTESKLPNHTWIDLAKYYMSSGKINPLLGALVHRNYSELESEFAELVIKCMGLEPEIDINILSAMSWLTVGQQEWLAHNYYNLRVMVSLVQLDGYLNCTLARQEGFGFWSAYPLSEMYVNHSSDALNSFFSALYSLASRTSNELLTNKALRLGIAGAKALGSRRSDSMVDLEQTVRNLLFYRRKGGGVTYAQIWEAAYDSLFQPLLDSLNQAGLSAYFKTYEKWVDTFDIDKHMDSWKSEIPEHLKKNSEYDKFARTQVIIKKFELDHAYDVYVQLQEGGVVKSDYLQGLKESIARIFKSKDKECILVKRWLESKLDDNSAYMNLHMSHDRSIFPDLGAVEGLQISALLPRAFVRNGFTTVTYAHIYTDMIVGWFGHNTVEHLVELYLDKGVHEGFSQILSTGNVSIPAKLERRLEKSLEDIAAEFEETLHAIKKILPIDRHGLLSKEIDRVESFIENNQWRQTQLALSRAKQVAADLNRIDLEGASRKSLLVMLEQLGIDDIDESWSVSKLNEHLETHYSKYEKRRAHIAVLQKLSSLEAIDFSAELSSCLRHLDNLNRYPEQAVSEQAAYYWEQAVIPLYSELARSNTLLPSYKEQLMSLVKVFLLSIRLEDNPTSESSVINSVLIDTADDWQNLPDLGRVAVDRILDRFEVAGVIKNLEDEESPSLDSALAAVDTFSAAQEGRAERSISILKAAAQNLSSVRKISDLPPVSGDVISSIEARDWVRVEQSSFKKLAAGNYESLDDLSNWAISALLSDSVEFDAPAQAAALGILNAKLGGQVVRYLHHDRAGKALVLALSVKFLELIAGGKLSAENTGLLDASKFIDNIQLLFDNVEGFLVYRSYFNLAFGSDNFDPLATKVLWEKFSGGAKQAEARALFMGLAWKLRSPDVLAYCLTLSPIDIDQRKSFALAQVAEQAIAGGGSELLQGFIDLRKSVSARPFQIFVDMMLGNAIEQGEQPARLTIVGDLERHTDKIFRAVLKISPRRVDSPDSLLMKLPTNAPIRFLNNAVSHELKGPFFTDTSVLLSFVLVNELATSFKVFAECEATSLTGNTLNYGQELSFSLKGNYSFSPLTPDEIDDAYDNFPDIHMRGDEYVPRIADEQKIEKALFKSKIVRSLWISSPRRSGKTSMLFRILDGFSHKADRDNLVVYLTLDEYYSSSMEFNRWIWKRLRTISSNRELRELYEDFDSIGRDLPYDTDSGTFIGELSDRLLNKNDNATRIIFLIDEVDRFATMYFQGETNKQTAIDILWQIRHTITDRRDIGIVFAGSSAAKQLFIANAESPFYNSIDHLELTPFSAKTKSLEEQSRKIVEPQKVRMIYDLPKESLEHLIWLCAGIPYYMKLVAGATLSKAKHSHILVSDVNEGLRALLARETGISKLDDMGGEPGSDEIRTTISTEKSGDGVLAKAVLYAFSELHSPLSGHRTYRGKISSVESKLVSHYNLSKVEIERGLDICIGLGLIRIVETDSVPELDFSIPILGESIRKSSGRLWANIDHELISLSGAGN
ncbi:ATP-binding protein [Pseudomonas corrugata]|uniref:hypothetical protein n=1 Tax=Pseudomonas corrugata TaxID=47879 RepID=UPI0028C475BD|nr:hypothetical protein [Pseudomonas corrugata]MDU9025149.1 hypothetical protein [Pseudomonas corrugata]